MRASLATLILFAAFAGCSSGTPPVLFPIEAASVNVNETLVMDINVLNQDGVALSWSFAGPALAALAETTELAGSPTGAVFRWTPLASHVGSHQFDFTASSDAGDSTQSVIITVVPQKGAAPIFIQPGKGGTFDLDVVSCVNFDVEVKDDDTSKVAIRTAGEVPAGLNLKTKGDQRARVDWCPTDSQLNQALSWTLSFEADDGEHEPTQHDYLAVFRRSAQAGCPGSPPSITILEPAPGAIVTSAAGFAVKVQVTDDSEIRDEPILYFTTADPGGAPDITSFTQTAFIQDGSDWVAQVPPVATPDGEPTPVWFAVSAVDNDDAAGTECDHRTDSPVQDFLAVFGGGSKAADCELCQGSEACESGVCSSQGKCMPACDNPVCGCVSVTTISGGTAQSCGGDAACNTAPEPVGECTPDQFSNDSLDNALSLLGGVLEGTICSVEESDWYKFTSGLDTLVTFSLHDLDKHDLDLELTDEFGNSLVIASTLAEIETLDHCVSAGSVTYARVHAWQGSATPYGTYWIEAEQASGQCCKNDPGEPDNSLLSATPVGDVFTGTLCPSDTDHVKFYANDQGNVTVIVDYAPADKLLDIAIHDPSGAKIGTGFGLVGEAKWEGYLEEAGDYTIAIDTIGGGTVEYGGTIDMASSASCSFTFDCPLKSVCDSGSCMSETCQAIVGCPIGHSSTQAKDGDFGTPCICTFDCVIDGECRWEQGEQCKWFAAGRSCGVGGSKKSGESCESFEDCQSQNACYGWEGGYCARLGCASNADCSGPTFCASYPTGNVCVRRCGDPIDPACRQSEGYICSLKLDTDGSFQSGCVISEDISI